MRLLALCAVTMAAFAANSVLTRVALVGDHIDAPSFALVRVGAGAAALVLLVALRDKRLNWPSRHGVAPTISLSAYVIGFTFAYLALDAGLGALILFGGVQVTMFLGAVLAREPISAGRWTGTGLAFGGVLVLLAPGAAAPPVFAVVMMLVAAIGWGMYSLLGRKAVDPLAETQKSFVLALPVVAVIWVAMSGSAQFSWIGVACAVVSGAVTSGMGYALWYWVLPQLPRVTAAVAQLTVPALAMLGGMVFLAEPLTWRFVVSSVLIITGVIVASRPARI